MTDEERLEMWRENVRVMKEKCETLTRWLDQAQHATGMAYKRLDSVERDWNRERTLRQEKQQEINGLEDALRNCETALAVSVEDLLAYKDYYGTSVAQVKHLQTCERMCSLHYVPPVPSCPDYPME